MKYIIAIIQPDRLDDVLEKLEEKEIHLVTVTSVIGRGRQQGIAEVYRSHKEPGNLLRKVKIEIAVNDEFEKTTIEAITSTARTNCGRASRTHFSNRGCLNSTPRRHGRSA